MFLKSIEIQGFKSFAHKTVLNFNEGMTAIVGPNGSGKSNIADAVRWVLGEQKVKQLRGASMQDVIFAGTELRKPLGFAYVSMTFDNADHALPLDYSEVSVSRRLFRSGESEYMINNQNVRLKDVQELFFDTGIGKEGYSIIGQGQIEAIVSGRPEEKRGLFDEACGIVKFKKRKQAAEKKLEEEEINLSRITDIKKELENRIGPLEKQSESAREYLKLRDALKAFELNIFVIETEALLLELEENSKNKKIVEESIDNIRKESDALKAMNFELCEELRATEEAISRGKDDKQKAELFITNLESQISVAKAEISAEKSNIVLFENGIEKLKTEGKERENTILSYLASIDKIRQDFRFLNDRDESVSGDEEFLEIRDLLTELESFETRLRSMLEDRIDSAEPSRDLPDPADTSEDFEFEEPEWLRSIKSKRNSISEINERAEQIKGWLTQTKQKLEKLQRDTRKETERRNEFIVKRNVCISKLETMKNVAERYEGYGTTVQSVMQLKASHKGILGVISDLIHTEQRFETAIETALGTKIQNVVTDSEKTARDVIDYLKKNRLGRATFLPLDSVTGKTLEDRDRYEEDRGFLGLASELVETDAEYEELVKNLLGNILVFDQVDNACKCAAKYKHGLKIVTLEGEYLSPGGSISGGTYKNSSNLMGRSREIGEMEKSLGELNLSIKHIESGILELEASIKEEEQEFEKLTVQIQEIDEEKNELSFGLMSDLKLKLANLNQSINFILENIKRTIEEYDKNRSDQSELRSKAERSEKIIEEKQTDIINRTDDIEHVKEGLRESLQKAEEARIHKEELAKSQSGYFERKDQISEETLSLEKDLIRLENSREKTESKLDTQSSHIWDEYGMTLSDARKLRDDALGNLVSMKEEAARIGSEIKGLGMINIHAIEEYKEVFERYELMKSQFEDVSAARAEINGIIKELDIGMKEQFSEQFAKIRNEFQKVFCELFGGGQADLELYYDEESEEEQDELNAGISISAQPPGKKLQNMMQLSGGEKAFTAIALLFAIQNLKPSPFCLLDEIEAALDDSNVYRFAQYVRKICGRSQFILITHRRGTMEAADRLYGITMQEKGVTSLVSVDLVEDSVK